MNILFCNDLNQINDKYDKIFILLEKVDFNIFNYLDNNYNIVLLNHDILLNSLFITKLSHKYKVFFFNIENTFLRFFNITNIVWKDCIKFDNIYLINYENKYSYIDNIIISFIKKIKNISSIDIFDYNIINKIEIQKLNRNIKFNIDMSKDTIINNKLKFFHIPKNAGTTIEYLGKIYGINWGINDEYLNCDDYMTDEYKNNILFDYYHYPICYYNDSIIKGKESFVIIRNPYSRIISQLFCKWNNYEKFYNILEFNFCFKSFLLNSFKKNYINSRIIKQTDFVFKNKKKIINHVLKMENLEDDFNNLMKKFDININIKNRKINVSNQKKKFNINNIRTELLYIFNNYYKDDFSNFGYNMKNIQFINFDNCNVIFVINNNIDNKFIENVKKLKYINFISNKNIDILKEDEYLLTKQNNLYNLLKNSIKKCKKDNILIFSSIIDISKIFVDTDKINYILKDENKYELNNPKLIFSSKDNLYELFDSIDEINEESLTKNESKFQLIL